MTYLCCPHCHKEVFATDVVEFNGVRVDGSRYVKLPSGKVLRLDGNQAVRVLTTLMHARGRTVTKDHLFNALYGLRPESDRPETDQVLIVHVHKLRKQLANGGVPLVIDTDWGRGWRLLAKEALS